MRLIKEQIKLLEDEIDYLVTNIENMKEMISSTHCGVVSNARQESSFADIKRQIVANDSRVKKIETILKDAVVIESSNSDTIGIGSRVSLFLDFGEGDIDEDSFIDFTLIEKKVSTESSENFITMDSALGKAIVGKKEKDKFSYKIFDNRVIEGIVMSCNKEKSEEKGLRKR